MTYLLHRIRESRGFVANRVMYQAYYLALMVYGQVAEIDGRIITPEIMYLREV